MYHRWYRISVRRGSENRRRDEMVKKEIVRTLPTTIGSVNYTVGRVNYWIAYKYAICTANHRTAGGNNNTRDGKIYDNRRCVNARGRARVDS